MLSQRDKLILLYLTHFRVLSRDHIAKLVCDDVVRPWATVNRIMKRLNRDGHVYTVPRPKDECYLYMPNPTIIHPESSKLRHFLAIVDFYIRIGKPTVYEVEPNIDPVYRPDAYTILRNTPIVIEVQRSHISNKKMQDKIDNFVDTFVRGKHDAKTFWIVSDEKFNVRVPSGFRLQHIPLKSDIPIPLETYKNLSQTV